MTRTTTHRPTKLGSEAVKYLVSASILGLGVAAMLFLWSLAKPPGNTMSNALTPLVETFDIQPYSGQLDIVVAGSVVPFREIKVAAEVSGRIKVKHDICQAGNFVMKGTPLLEIDPEEYKLELITIKADVNQAEKMLQEAVEEIRGATRNIELAENEFRLQRGEYKRIQLLKGVVSPSELDTAEHSLLNSESQLTARRNTLGSLVARKARLEASLELSKSNLSKTELNLKRTTIYAPDDGVIVRDMVEQGDFVSRGSQLVLFEDTRRAEIICNLTSNDLDWIRKNSANSNSDTETSDPYGRSVYKLPKTAVTIYERDEPEIEWQGVLERFDGIGRDELTNTTPCRIVVDNPVTKSPHGQRALVRGMYVKCRMEVHTSTIDNDNQFFSFPELAVRPGNFIWIVRDHKLHRVDIKIADRIKATLNDRISPFVVIPAENTNLEIGDQIVLSPLSQPLEGSVVLLKGEELGPRTTSVVEEKKASVEKTGKPSTAPTT